MKQVSKRRIDRLLREKGFIYQGSKKHAKWRHPDGRFVSIATHPKQDYTGPVVNRILRGENQ